MSSSSLLMATTPAMDPAMESAAELVVEPAVSLDATSPSTSARSGPSKFELLMTCNPPILESLLAQVSTETIFRLHQTSPYLRDFFARSPTSWRYISWRLYQPTTTTAVAATTNHAAGASPRQSSNYALDQILLNIINPFSTRLVSLELDNTAVSGATLTSTVLILRRDTLLHVSVRGCKNVSLKYHINPWLQMHALARDSPAVQGPPGFETLALKSLYTYRCRHHRRRPYLPSSLARKESDSEPTHELVLTCHKLGIWTDTAWCTTPGARCYRRRGYVKMRMPQDPREVWVVYDRLWRSRNWLGPLDPAHARESPYRRAGQKDCRMWEFDEEAINGEPVGTGHEAKATPAHLRRSHRQFVDNITCHNCAAEILERCEQCSVMMHCTGCRKTLCASCAFDRPYLRNKHAPADERNKFWWAPGCAVSPCSMQDQDVPLNAAPNANPTPTNMNALPNIKFRWCCTEPVFSGGGGITFGNGSSRDTDCIRAAPLPPGHGWEDAEFSPDRVEDGHHDHLTPSPSVHTAAFAGPGGRWSSIDSLFEGVWAPRAHGHGHGRAAAPVPRVLCDDCYSSDHWKLKCKACATVLCLRHDIAERVKAKICGYRDLLVERQEHGTRHQALKLLAAFIHRRDRLTAPDKASTAPPPPDTNPSPARGPAAPLPWSHSSAFGHDPDASILSHVTTPPLADPDILETLDTPRQSDETPFREPASMHAQVELLMRNWRASRVASLAPHRSVSPDSSGTGPASRSPSPSPSTHSTTPAPETASTPRRPPRPDPPPMPMWRGCQAFFCPTTRAPGDHRRRCTAIMRQCVDCKIYVCADCVSNIEPPCPCKGCRVSPASEDTPSASALGPAAGAAEPVAFFCPNCRWERMFTGKCKRKSKAFLNLQSLSQSAKKSRRKKAKIRKPIDERRTRSVRAGSLASTDEAIDGLVDFFTGLNAQFVSPGLAEPHRADVPPEATSATNDIQELEDMGALARDLIRRIQRLRDQFRPGSLAALALPDIRLEDDDNVTRLSLPMGLPLYPIPDDAVANDAHHLQNMPVAEPETDVHADHDVEDDEEALGAGSDTE